MNIKKSNVSPTKKQEPKKVLPISQNIQQAMWMFQKDKVVANKSSKNPFFKTTYSSLEEVMSACDQANKYGILYGFESTVTETGNLIITATATHVGSQTQLKLSVPCFVPNLHDPQKLGSSITYAKRYSLQALFALASVDDDGNKASGIIVPNGNVNPPKNPGNERAITTPKNKEDFK